MTGHAVEINGRQTVCRTCGHVGTPEELVDHAVDTFLHGPAPETSPMRRAS